MIDKNNKEYWKCQPCKAGDTVEVSEDLEYAAKTIYKVAYYTSDFHENRILIEVDSRKNYRDLEWIKGWVAFKFLNPYDIKKYQVDHRKRYWWIYYWNLIKESKFLKNE